MLSVLQSSVNAGMISGLGALFGIGGIALTLLWLRAFYRPSGI